MRFRAGSKIRSGSGLHYLSKAPETFRRFQIVVRRAQKAPQSGSWLGRTRPRPQGEVENMGLEPQSRVYDMQAAEDARRHPRFKLEAELRIYARDCPVVRGHTVDISESGVSAMLRVEVPLGTVVRLEFDLPLGSVEIPALVRQRRAFRYGFQFLEASTAQETIGRTCAQLALEQSPHLRLPDDNPGKI